MTCEIPNLLVGIYLQNEKLPIYYESNKPKIWGVKWKCFKNNNVLWENKLQLTKLMTLVKKIKTMC
jgi:hypothetical protein